MTCPQDQAYPLQAIHRQTGDTFIETGMTKREVMAKDFMTAAAMKLIGEAHQQGIEVIVIDQELDPTGFEQRMLEQLQRDAEREWDLYFTLQCPEPACSASTLDEMMPEPPSPKLQKGYLKKQNLPFYHRFIK